jgi:hypothetical protein
MVTASTSLTTKTASVRCPIPPSRMILHCPGQSGTKVKTAVPVRAAGLVGGFPVPGRIDLDLGTAHGLAVVVFRLQQRRFPLGDLVQHAMASGRGGHHEEGHEESDGHACPRGPGPRPRMSFTREQTGPGRPDEEPRHQPGGPHGTPLACRRRVRFEHVLTARS